MNHCGRIHKSSGLCTYIAMITTFIILSPYKNTLQKVCCLYKNISLNFVFNYTQKMLSENTKFFLLHFIHSRNVKFSLFCKIAMVSSIS